MNPKEMVFKDGDTSVTWRKRTEGWSPGSEYLTIESGYGRDMSRAYIEMPFVEEIVRKVRAMRRRQ